MYSEVLDTVLYVKGMWGRVVVESVCKVVGRV